jgi:1-pyrroline-5-carboxylate dehydrogenase
MYIRELYADQAQSIDFLKTFPTLAEQLYKAQPPFNSPGVWNRSECRPIDGFVYAISPFNFTALAVNLVLAPIIVGNVVIWKPSPGAILSSHLFNKIMIEAGLPAGVLQFLPGDAELVSDAVFANKNLGALHFTGSTHVFRNLWKKVGDKIDFWVSYPRLIGETSGKNFHLVHKTAKVRNAALKTIRAAFEYQGQKCSACSRVYVSKSVADEFIDIMKAETGKLNMGDKLTDFCGPVINGPAFERVKKAIESARNDSKTEVLEGGECDDSVGYYIVSCFHPPERKDTEQDSYSDRPSSKRAIPIRNS